MLIIGLTGIIGAGKSTVAKIFKRDFPVLLIDADKIGHKILSQHPDTMQKTITAFGTNKRSELAKLVFKNFQKLKALNKITHPAIRRKVMEIIKNNPKEKIVIIDAALLFTIGLHRFCNKIIFVEAAEEQILQRLLNRGLSAKEIFLRLKANQKVLQLKKKCSLIINNNGSKKELIRAVQETYKKLQK